MNRFYGTYRDIPYSSTADQISYAYTVFSRKIMRYSIERSRWEIEMRDQVGDEDGSRCWGNVEFGCRFCA
jgi:hypothetical protein